MHKEHPFKRVLKLFIVLLIFITLCPTAIVSNASTKGITLNKKSALVKVGGTINLKVTSASSTVKWSTDNKNIATVKNGQVTAKGVGTVTIKAQSGKMFATCKITVYQPAKKVVLSVDNNYIEVGDTFKVTPQITPENATYKNFTWSVENDSYWYSSIKQISKNKFKAVEEGTATIIAYEKNTNKKYELRVEVKEALGSFHVEMNDKKVNSLNTFIGGHLLVNGKLDKYEEDYWYDIEPDFKYSVKDKKIASIDNRGQITGKSAGSTLVYVTASNGKSVSCKLTVTKEKENLSIDTFYANNLMDKVGIGNYMDWSNWSSADTTYILKLTNNQIGVFNRISSKNKQSLHVFLYDQNFNYINQKTIELPYTEWGGFYQGEDGYYYAAVGQTNEKQDNSKIVYSILKLDENFKEVGRCNITGAETNTRIPYDVGFARMTMDGTTLIVHTDRERYTSSDGLNHQSNITFMIDSLTMRQSYVGALFPYNHVSHSFNQFVKMDGNNLIYVDHGDAYPRSVVMQTHYNFSLYGWNDKYGSRPYMNELDLINIVGEVGDNYTGTKVNGFELGTNNNLVAGVSIPHDSLTSSSLKTYDEKNVYVSLVSKDGVNSKLIWLTNYKSGGGISANNLRMVKISDNEFALIYQIVKNEPKNTDSKSYSTGLIIIDSNGIVVKKKEYDLFYSCNTQPMYYDNSIVWIDSKNYSSGYYWYEDDEANQDKIEQSQFTRIYLK